MSNAELDAILARAVDVYGAENQLLMVFEELGELMTALVQWQRGRVKTSHVCEEVADALVMLSQVGFILEAMDVNMGVDGQAFTERAQRIAHEKVFRLLHRMEAE
jgi:NTP pyrophosphatase (non-canonical NTP hydrolase)